VPGAPGCEPGSRDGPSDVSLAFSRDYGVDLELLSSWMDDQKLGSGPLIDVRPISGGSQNVLLRFRRDDDDYVLRRPPLHKRGNSDETMRREARVLGCLAGTSVPHPRLIAACSDISVIGAAFYLMEPVEGFNPVIDLPASFRENPRIHREMGFALAAGIAELTKVDYEAVGLGDFGRPTRWLERQVSRWLSQLSGYSAFEGYPESALPGVPPLAEWISQRVPAVWSPGLIHGDYHFGNVLFESGGTKLAAIVDWELATIGDPLLDLGHLLAQWPQPESPPGVAVLDLPGLPTRDEMISHYAESAGRDVSHALWYQVLACFRLAIILEGSYARACAGQAPQETGERLHKKSIALVEQAGHLIDSSDRRKERA